MNGFQRLVVCLAVALALPASALAQQNAPSAESGPAPAPSPEKKAKRKAAHKKKDSAAAAPAPAPDKGKTAETVAKTGVVGAPPVVAIKPAAAPAAAAPASGSGKSKAAEAQTASSAAKMAGPTCAIEDAEQPRGGRLDLTGSGFGQSPLVKIAGKPVRMIERREDRLSVQVPADSNGGAVTVLAQGQSEHCGALVIIGKNR